MEQLSEQDINTLIEALKSWEDKDFGTGIMMDMVEMMVTDTTAPNHKADLAKKREERSNEAKKSKMIREERSILLKAKLISMRDSIIASSLTK